MVRTLSVAENNQPGLGGSRPSTWPCLSVLGVSHGIQAATRTCGYGPTARQDSGAAICRWAPGTDRRRTEAITQQACRARPSAPAGGS